MKNYTSFEALKLDLEQLKLEQQIAWEELKLTKNEFSEQLTLPNWFGAIGKGFVKYGLFMMLKRIFK
ncbi:hypothetical protein [Winogradskyella sp. A3E31]|uniref:hypothetical protein n=1 Tax=Winogradskyella sp. A3E31 TaxID=3349637 RepID=UPI00398AFCF4